MTLENLQPPRQASTQWCLTMLSKSQNQYLNPYILEERTLNVTQMDVFSRLMMDRIIFLGTQIDDYTANTLRSSTSVSGFNGSLRIFLST